MAQSGGRIWGWLIGLRWSLGVPGLEEHPNENRRQGRFACRRASNRPWPQKRLRHSFLIDSLEVRGSGFGVPVKFSADEQAAV